MSARGSMGSPYGRRCLSVRPGHSRSGSRANVLASRRICVLSDSSSAVGASPVETATDLLFATRSIDSDRRRGAVADDLIATQASMQG